MWLLRQNVLSQSPFDSLNEAAVAGISPIHYLVISLNGKKCHTIIIKPLANTKHKCANFLIHISIAIFQHTFFQVLSNAGVKAKNELDKFKQAMTILFRALKIGERTQFEFNFAETKARKVFKSWSGAIIGHLCLLISLTLRRNKLSPMFMTVGSFITWSKLTMNIRFLVFYRDCGR